MSEAKPDLIRGVIREHVVSTWLSGDSRDFSDQTDLLEAGVLDSFATLSLTGFLTERFGIQLDPVEVNAETFRSVDTLVALVLRHLGQTG